MAEGGGCKSVTPSVYGSEELVDVSYRKSLTPSVCGSEELVDVSCRKSCTSGVYGSEEVVEFPCAPCSRGGKVTDGVNFCADCGDLFCATCTEYHAKMSLTAGHRVVPRSDAGSATRTSGPLPTETCKAHAGEKITSYCVEHRTAVCNTCVSIDHRLCGQVLYIPSISGDAKTSQDVPRVKNELSTSLQAIKSVRVHVQKYQTTADYYKTENLKAIDDHAELLMQHVQTMKQAAVDDVLKGHKEITDALTDDVTILDETTTALEKRLKNLDNDQANPSQAFVDTKLGSREAEAARQLGQRLTPAGTGNVRSMFVVDDRVDVILSDVNSLGKIVKHKPYKVILEGTYNIGMKKDIIISEIVDACELSGGDIIMTDLNNYCIKTLQVSKSYKIAKRFKMPGWPWGICQTNNTEIAVTLTDAKKVQFVDISGNWKMARSFSVEDSCRGIAYSGGNLIVACGGHSGTESNAPEGPAFLGIYDLSGSLLQKIQLDGRGRQMFSVPRHIITSNDGKKIHVADEEGGVITLDKQGKILSTFNEKLQLAIGLCAIEDENLVICGFESKNVLQITANGELVSELLSRKDGIKYPWCVVYSQTKSSLIVMSNRSKDIQVYNLSA